MIESSRAPKCNRKCQCRKTHWSWNIDGEPQDSLFFFFFFPIEADERNPPIMRDCTRLREPVERQPLGCQKTQCIGVVLLISASSFQTALKITRLLDKRLTLVVFSTAGAGVNYFFWTLFRSVFLLMCIHVFAPSLPGW